MAAAFRDASTTINIPYPSNTIHGPGRKAFAVGTECSGIAGIRGRLFRELVQHFAIEVQNPGISMP